MPDKSLTALKTLVISMGIVLIVGVVMVGAAAWMKFKPAARAAGIFADCAGGTLDMKGRGRIVDTAVDGRVMRIAFARPAGELEMVHVDICSGKEISALKLSVDVP